MTHSQLVQAATDLISEVGASEQWLDDYDDALNSSSDRELGALVYQLSAALQASVPLAA